MFKPMQPDVKKLWVEALRSGEYKQARGHLKLVDDQSNEQFCVLGILCDLHRKHVTSIEWDYYTYPYLEDDSTWKVKSTGIYFSSDCSLPLAVQEWAGLKDSIPCVSPSLNALKIVYQDTMVRLRLGEKVSLAALNDDGVNFEDLANVIEYCL